MTSFFIAVPAANCSAQAVRGTGFTADEALDDAYDRAGFRYHPYVRYDARASGGRFDHLLDVADTEGWVAFDGRCNELGAFYEKDVAQRAADRTGFVARECSEEEFLAAREGDPIAAAAEPTHAGATRPGPQETTMKNCHALRCDLLPVMARIADRAARVPETETRAQRLREVTAHLERSKRVAATWILVEASRLMGQIEGVWHMKAQADFVEGGPDLDTAIRFVNEILLYGTNPDDEYDAVVDDSEHALHRHENHVVPAAAFEL